MFGFAGLYALFILCMCSRIKLGIAINKVAAQFVFQTKMIIFLPVWQILVCMIWWLVWLIGAMHIVSQFDDDSAPKDAFTYDKAAGTATEPGECCKGTGCYVLRARKGIAYSVTRLITHTLLGRYAVLT